MNYKSILLLLIISLISCQQEVDFERTSGDSKLVVNGNITNEYKAHSIELSLSGGLSQNFGFEKVSGATLSIMEGDSRMIPLSEVEPGRYLTDSIAGKLNELYTLQITWNGQTFNASDSLISIAESVVPIDFTTTGGFKEYEFRRHQFGLNIASKEVIVIAPSTPKSKIDTARAGLTIGVKLLPGGTYQFTGYNHPKIEVNGLLNFEDGKFFGFKEGAQISHQLFSLSEEYYEYLRSIFIETEWRGTLFDTPPANVKGNIDNGALGFFSAHEVNNTNYTIN